MATLVIGFGKMGMLHAATLNALGAGPLVICDRSTLVRDAVRKFAPHLEFVTDWRLALKRGDIKRAVVATPTGAHAAILSELIPLGIPVFVEKPLATSPEEAHSLLNLIQTFPETVVMVGHCLRFVPTFERAKAAIREGVLGRIQSFDGRMFSSDVLTPARSWRFGKGGASQGAGVLLDLGSHLADMLRMLFGMPDAVRGRAQRLVSEHTEDAFESLWEYSNFSGTCEASWSRPEARKATLGISVEGSNGRLYVSDDQLVVEITNGHGDWLAGFHREGVTRLDSPVPFDLAGPFYTRQLQEWLRASDGSDGSGPYPYRNTIAENHDNLVLLDAIRRSQGRPLSLLSAKAVR